MATGWQGFASPWLNAVWLVLVGLLMISRLPTFSVKKARLRRDLVLPAILGIAVIAAAMVSLPWWSLVVISVAYMTGLPLAWREARRRAREAEAG